MRRSGAAIANRAGLFDLYGSARRVLSKSEVVVIMYHRISAKRDDWSLESVTSDHFEKHIEYFCNNYRILPLEELATSLSEKKRAPQRSLVITMDDGYKDNYAHAYPILLKYGVPATIFLTTGHISTDELLWWDKVGYILHHTSTRRLRTDCLGRSLFKFAGDRSQLTRLIVKILTGMSEVERNSVIQGLSQTCGVEIPGDLGREMILSWDEVHEMSRNGVEFGAHSVSHPCLTRLPADQARWQINRSMSDIEARLGKAPKFFAYPAGDYDESTVEMVREAGFAGAVTTVETWIDLEADVYMLGRIGAPEDLNEVRMKLCGLWGDLGRLFGGR